jgi:hypothetical protein
LNRAIIGSWVEDQPIIFTEEYMPRKRTPDQSATGTEDQPVNEASTATVETPESEIPEQSQSFVERLQQQRGRGIAPDPFGIAGDYVAGVRLFENRRQRLMAIKFEEKPSPEVLGKMKEAGYRWNPNDKVWVHPIPEEAARTTRIEAERLYQEVRGMIRQEKGIESGQEIPF